MRLRVRDGWIQYAPGRAWEPSRILRACCKAGLHFLAHDLRRDGWYCECGRNFLLAEQVRP